MDNSNTNSLKDSEGIKYKYPNRDCKECLYYKCFVGIENLSCNFAKYGCRKYCEAVSR